MMNRSTLIAVMSVTCLLAISLDVFAGPRHRKLLRRCRTGPLGAPAFTVDETRLCPQAPALMTFTDDTTEYCLYDCVVCGGLGGLGASYFGECDPNIEGGDCDHLDNCLPSYFYGRKKPKPHKDGANVDPDISEHGTKKLKPKVIAPQTVPPGATRLDIKYNAGGGRTVYAQLYYRTARPWIGVAIEVPQGEVTDPETFVLKVANPSDPYEHVVGSTATSLFDYAVILKNN